MRWNAFVLAVAPWLLRVALEAVFLPEVDAARPDLRPCDEPPPDAWLVDQTPGV